MTDFKVLESGWYRTRDGREAEVVVNLNGGKFKVVGYISGATIAQSWQDNGYCMLDIKTQGDLVEYLGKERPKEPKKYKTTVVLYEDGRATLDGILCESHPLKPSPKVVKTQVIEWEVPDNG